MSDLVSILLGMFPSGMSMDLWYCLGALLLVDSFIWDWLVNFVCLEFLTLCFAAFRVTRLTSVEICQMIPRIALTLSQKSYVLHFLWAKFLPVQVEPYSILDCLFLVSKINSTPQKSKQKQTKTKNINFI